jgi:type I restriction enzyme S subunit
MDFSEKEREKFSLLPGDLLVCEGGEPGRCAIWEGQKTNCYYQKALHRIRPISNNLSPEYLMYWIWHQALSGAFEDQNAKTTIAHLPVVRLSLLSIPLPAIKIQKQVAARLREMLSSVREAEKTISSRLQEISALPQKLLSNAFEIH